jgi:hypothetical protein
MKRRLVGVTAAVLGTVLIGGVGLHSTASAAPLPVTTVTLPLFGAPLTIDITTGPGGALADVSVDPADNTVATKLKPRKVVFQSSNPADPTADPAKVVIKSGKGGQSVSARAGSLGEVSGPGGWVGDVFGDGTQTTVAFTIGVSATGGPDITGVSATGSANEVNPTQYSSGDDDDESEQSARASIKFTNATGDQSRTLSIKVKVEEDDGRTEAKLSISLGRIKGVEGKAVGTHTWTGMLCDTNLASIGYTVAADGSISFGTITPAGATTSIDDGKATVTFETGEQVRIKVRDHDGQMTVSVKERIRCDSDDPVTNVETSIADDNHDGDHHDDGDHKGGDHGRGGDDDDNTTSTSSTTAP